MTRVRERWLLEVTGNGSKHTTAGRLCHAIMDEPPDRGPRCREAAFPYMSYGSREGWLHRQSEILFFAAQAEAEPLESSSRNDF